MEEVSGGNEGIRGWGQIREIPRRRTAGMPEDWKEERFLWGIGLGASKREKGLNWN